MITSHHLKELTHIKYDRDALIDFYHQFKHLARTYNEVHTDGHDDSPYFRCACKECKQNDKHKNDNITHMFIRRLERFDNPEINRLIKELEYLTKTNVPNYPVLWIYGEEYTLPPHRDFARSSSIIIPILPEEGESTVDIYSPELPVVDNGSYKKVEHNEEYLIKTHVYRTDCPTVINACNVTHGVRNKNSTRVFLNFTSYLDWEMIV